MKSTNDKLVSKQIKHSATLTINVKIIIKIEY